MKRLQKLVTVALAFVLALSLSLTALAVKGEYGEEVSNGELFQDNQAVTTFSAVSVPEKNLSATVPLNVTFAVKSDGTLVCPKDYAIANTSTDTDDVFHISDIKITMLDSSYSLVNKENPDSNEIYFTMTGTNSYTDATDTIVLNSEKEEQAFGLSGSTIGTWNVPGNSSITFELDGKMNSEKREWITGHELFSVEYTIAAGQFYDPRPE